MGMYDELPVYKAGYDLLLEIFSICPEVSVRSSNIRLAII